MEKTQRGVAIVKCLSVIAQVSLGYYDEEGNLVGDEMFPQTDGSLLTAKLFHPHAEQLGILIQACIEQAWAKLGAQGRVVQTGAASDDAALDGRAPVASLAGDKSEAEAT